MGSTKGEGESRSKQVLVRITPTERLALEKAMRAHRDGLGQAAAKYIIEGLKKDGFLPKEEP